MRDTVSCWGGASVLKDMLGQGVTWVFPRVWPLWGKGHGSSPYLAWLTEPSLSQSLGGLGGSLSSLCSVTLSWSLFGKAGPWKFNKKSKV